MTPAAAVEIRDSALAFPELYPDPPRPCDPKRKAAPQPDDRINVYLSSEVTADERARIEREIQRLPRLEAVYFEDSASAFVRFKDLFACSPDLIDDVQPQALPSSYMIIARLSLRFQKQLRTYLERLPGVDEVSSGQLPIPTSGAGG